MVKSNLLAEFAVSKDRLIQALACVSNLADRAVVQAIVHPKDTILGFAFSNTLVNGESGEQIYAYYVTTPAPLKGQASTVLIPTDCSPNLSICQRNEVQVRGPMRGMLGLIPVSQ